MRNLNGTYGKWNKKTLSSNYTLESALLVIHEEKCMSELKNHQKSCPLCRRIFLFSVKISMHSCIYLFPFERLCVLHSITQFELSVALPLLQAVAWQAFHSFIEENGMSVFYKNHKRKAII